MQGKYALSNPIECFGRLGKRSRRILGPIEFLIGVPERVIGLIQYRPSGERFGNADRFLGFYFRRPGVTLNEVHVG